MFIKRLRANVYDVFVGNGWNKWARVARNGGEVKQIAGSFDMDQRTLNTVKGRLTK